MMDEDYGISYFYLTIYLNHNYFVNNLIIERKSIICLALIDINKARKKITLISKSPFDASTYLPL